MRPSCFEPHVEPCSEPHFKTFVELRLALLQTLSLPSSLLTLSACQACNVTNARCYTKRQHHENMATPRRNASVENGHRCAGKGGYAIGMQRPETLAKRARHWQCRLRSARRTSTPDGQASEIDCSLVGARKPQFLWPTLSKPKQGCHSAGSPRQ